MARSRAQKKRLAKSVMQRLGALSLAQRADLQYLLSQGVAENEARAIVMGISKAREDARLQQKAAPLGSDVHVPVPMGGRKKQLRPVAKAGQFDENKHPRADDGKFGEGSGSSSPSGGSGASAGATGHSIGTIHGTDKKVYHSAAPDSEAYSSFSSADHLKAGGVHSGAAYDARDRPAEAAHHDAMNAAHREYGQKMKQKELADQGAIGESSKGLIYADAEATDSRYDRFDSGDHAYAALYHQQIADGAKGSASADQKATHAQLARDHLALSKGPKSARLSAAEKKSLLNYQYSGDDAGNENGKKVKGVDSDYRKINAASSGDYSGMSESEAKSAKAHAAVLQAAISKQSSTKAETLYRGAMLDTVPKVGGVVASQRLTSASDDKNVAAGFLSERDGNKGKNKILFTIDTPKGSQVLDVNKMLGSRSKIAGEGERLFGSGQKFEVSSVVKDGDGVHHVKMKAIPPQSGGGATNKSAPVHKAEPIQATANELAYIKAAYGLQIPTEAPVPDAETMEPVVQELVQANRLVAGMDAEFAANTAITAEDARARASRNLLERPGFYDGVGTNPDIRGMTGLMLDICPGNRRAEGYLGLDLLPFDHGTVIHDVECGLPFPDASVRAIRMNRVLHAVIDAPGASGDPLPLLTECQRVLMEGGRLYYDGPEPLVEEGRWPLPGLVLMPGGKGNAQELRRVPLRYPAFPGADARFHAGPPLPLDIQMALAASNAAPAEHAVANLVNKALNKVVPIAKADKMKQIITGVVLEPHSVDLQGDFLSPEDIEKSAHAYLMKSRIVGSEHGRPIDAGVVESYIAPQDLSFKGLDGETSLVPKGSWVMSVKISDADEWNAVISGDYTGFSVGGYGERDEAA